MQVFARELVPHPEYKGERCLRPRSAIVVCAAAAILGWLGVGGAVYLGKTTLKSLQASNPIVSSQ